VRVGAARVLLALFVTVGVLGACGTRDEPARGVGAGLAVPTPTTQVQVATSAPAGATGAPAQTPVRAPRRAVRAASARPIGVGRIVIPKIGVDLETYEGVDQRTLKFGPSRWEISARPGQSGNTVFAGHRTTFTRPFYDIDLLAVGDEVTFVTESGVHTYRTTQFFVVGEADVWIAEPTDTPTFTLFACHPKGSERQRYVVKGDLVRSETFGAPPPSPAEPAPTRQPRKCLLCAGG
jgi:sortase A